MISKGDGVSATHRDRNGGARTGRVREQSRSFADAGRRKSPEAVPRPTGRTGDATERNIMLRVAAVVGTAQSKPSPIGEPVLEVDAGSRAVKVTNPWLGNWDAPEYSAKTTRRRDVSASDSCDLTGQTRITDESVPKPRGNVSVTNCSVRPELSDCSYRCQFD